MNVRDPQAVVVYEPLGLAAKRVGIAALLFGAASLLFALVVALYIIWLVASPVSATAFDADGVRCYHRAAQVACLKTANP